MRRCSRVSRGCPPDAAGGGNANDFGPNAESSATLLVPLQRPVALSTSSERHSRLLICDGSPAKCGAGVAPAAGLGFHIPAWTAAWASGKTTDTFMRAQKSRRSVTLAARR